MSVATTYFLLSMLTVLLSFGVLTLGFQVLPSPLQLSKKVRYAIIMIGTLFVYVVFSIISPQIGDILFANSIDRLTVDRSVTNFIIASIGVAGGIWARHVRISPLKKRK